MKPISIHVIIGLTLLIVVSLSTAFLYKYSNINRGQSREYTLGWIGPLSGNVSALGKNNLKAIKLAISENNNKKTAVKFKLIEKDDEYNVAKAKSAYEDLVYNQGIRIIFMSSYDAVSSLGDIAQKDGVLLVNPIDNDSNLARINRNIFLIAKQTSQMAEALVIDFKDNNHSNLFLIYNTQDHFMPELADQVQFYAKAAGMHINSVSYQGDNITESLKQLRNPSFDNSVTLFLGYKEVATAMKDLRSYGNKSQFYTVNLSMKSEAGEAIKGTKFLSFDYESVNKKNIDAFSKIYMSQYGQFEEKWTAFQAYDAANIVFKSVILSQNQQGIFIDNVRTNILKTRNYEGVSGIINMKPDGSSRGINWTVFSYDNG